MNVAIFSVDGPKGQNDDRALPPVDAGSGWFAAIADGVGGNAGGGEAADAALEAIKFSLDQHFERPFEEAFRKACDSIRERTALNAKKSNMATTLSVVRSIGNRAYVGHVGDTRIYHIRGSGIVTRTKDQTEVAELMRQGILTPSQAKVYARRNVLTSYLNKDQSFDIFECDFSIEPKDTIVLLTDGVYGEIKKSEILEARNSSHDLLGFADRIKSLVLNRGVKDDSTMLAIEIS